MSKALSIAGRPVGLGHPPFIVAELSANHNGSLDRALEVVRAAANCGVDAVKLQTYTADTLTIDHNGPDFVIRGGLWDGRTLYDLYEEAHTPWDWHPVLFEIGRSLNLPVFSTPFDETAVDFLQSLGAPAYKIASFEMVDHALIRKIAAAGMPTIMSTGMASNAEIDEAVAAFRGAGGRDLILLHCISGYPTPVEQINLRRIPEMMARYDCAIGLSDHTMGTEVAIAAVAMGACLIEKHFIMRRSDGGPDSAFSMEPEEMRALVSGAHKAFLALGVGGEKRADVEKGSLAFRRSIYVVRDVALGEKLTAENVRIIRPGFGLAPKHLPDVLGHSAARPLSRGTALTWDMIEKGSQSSHLRHLTA
ncbi:MAG TPA: pseudaminic acid synthase [Rhizomicrobium sp.]|nr:pseudaminic acid synthase [Rhizomicrobium sp.]